MVWRPPSAVVAAGVAAQRELHYIGGSVPGPGESLQLAPGRGAVALAQYIRAHFPGVSSVGLRRGSEVQRPAVGADGALRRRDIHEEGRALDVMLDRVSAGAAVADWLVLHAVHLGVQLVIYDRVEWSAGRGAAWENYGGSDPHTGHVHLELVPVMAASADLMWSALGSIDSEVQRLLVGLAVGGGVALAGLVAWLYLRKPSAAQKRRRVQKRKRRL